MENKEMFMVNTCHIEMEGFNNIMADLIGKYEVGDFVETRVIPIPFKKQVIVMK